MTQMTPARRDRTHSFRLPPDAARRFGWWALFLAVMTMIAATQSAVATIALSGGVRVFFHSMVVFGTAAWLWVATAPFIIDLSRSLEWRSPRSGASYAAMVIGAHAATFALIAGVHTAWWRFVIREFTNIPASVPFLQSFIGRFDTHLFTYLAIVIAVHAAGHWHRLLATAREAARVETQLVATRLQVLMMQLQPHFLFNTLHSISELVHRDGAAARRTVGHLRDLLGFSFSGATRAEVPLREEMHFLGTYMEIQRMRFGDRLTIEMDVAPDAANARVPALVLQPLVENAIRHGTAPLGAHGHIRIVAVRRAERLELRVEDNGRGPGTPRPDGQGLRNTRVRLQELYGDRQGVRLERGVKGGTISVVNMPFRDSPGADDSASLREGSEIEDMRTGTPNSLRLIPLVMGFWAFFGILWTAQVSAIAVIGGRPLPPLPAALWPNLGNAAAWVIMTGIIIMAVRRWPARREGWPSRLVLHAALALGVSAALMAARWLVTTGGATPFFSLAHTGWLGWDLMTYCVIAGFTQAASIAKRGREADVRVAWLEAELATAQLDALKWQLQPQFLVDTLDAIAVASISDPDRADDMTTFLGSLLRLMLEQIGTEASTVAREIELMHVYAEIQRMRRGGGLSMTVTMSPDAGEAPVPGVLLLPIVAEFLELASSTASPIASLALTVDARNAGGVIVLTVEGRGDFGLTTANDADPTGTEGDWAASAIGVNRARSRLAAAHSGRSLVVAGGDGWLVRRVTMEIPPAYALLEAPTRRVELAGAHW